MADRNHRFRFRPLRPGLMIFNPEVRQHGTIGLFLEDDTGAGWLLSAKHALVPAAPGAPSAGTIFQPWNFEPGNDVADVAGVRLAGNADCAAVRLAASVAFSNRILSIGPVAASAVAPQVGMHVIKSGATTGITEGVVVGVAGDVAEIRPLPEFPSSYLLTDRGDSGSVWLERSTLRPAVLHHTGEMSGAELARGLPMPALLDALGLRISTA